MNVLTKIINISIWILLCVLVFNYAMIWTFEIDPGIKGGLMVVIFIHMVIGINAATKRN